MYSCQVLLKLLFVHLTSSILTDALFEYVDVLERHICAGDEDMTLTCPSRAFIWGQQAMVGYTPEYSTSPDGGDTQCPHNEDDCTAPFNAFSGCVAATSCSFNPTHITQEINTQCAEDQGVSASNYAYMEYNCLSVDTLQTVDICSSTTDERSSTTHFVSPAFPAEVGGGSHECACVITPLDFSTIMDLRCFHVSLPSTVPCAEEVIVRDETNDVVIYHACSPLLDKEIIDIQYQAAQISIQFRKSSSEIGGKIWTSFGSTNGDEFLVSCGGTTPYSGEEEATSPLPCSTTECPDDTEPPLDSVHATQTTISEEAEVTSAQVTEEAEVTNAQVTESVQDYDDDLEAAATTDDAIIYGCVGVAVVLSTIALMVGVALWRRNTHLLRAKQNPPETKEAPNEPQDSQIFKPRKFSNGDHAEEIYDYIDDSKLEKINNATDMQYELPIGESGERYMSLEDTHHVEIPSDADKNYQALGMENKDTGAEYYDDAGKGSRDYGVGSRRQRSQEGESYNSYLKLVAGPVGYAPDSNVPSEYAPQAPAHEDYIEPLSTGERPSSLQQSKYYNTNEVQYPNKQHSKRVPDYENAVGSSRHNRPLPQRPDSNGKHLPEYNNVTAM